MDEITILASAASALLAAGVTRLFVKPKSPVIVSSRQLETVDSAHKHVFAKLQGDMAYCIVEGCGASLKRELNG